VELRLTGEAQALARWAVEQPELAALRVEEGAIVISVRSPREILPRLQKAAATGGIPLRALDPLDLNLDAVFQYLTKDNA
jgi:ABC-2 type transport system ATP-binding protein